MDGTQALQQLHRLTHLCVQNKRAEHDCTEEISRGEHEDELDEVEHVEDAGDVDLGFSLW